MALWRKRRAQLATQDEDTSQDPSSNREIISGLRFLYENYKTRSWYWELVEMTRKVILTCGLIFVGQESRSYIGLALVIAGMYGFVFAWVKPLQDATENRLMTTSLAVTVVNLVIGAVSKIPAEYVTSWIGPETDALLFKILVFAANSLVIGQLVVEYENEEGDVNDDDDAGGNTVEGKDNNHQGVNCSSKTNNQGTQTEFLSLFTMADYTVNESFEETHLKITVSALPDIARLVKAWRTADTQASIQLFI
ncbi:hypothetical protein ACROYT_G014294 [Oculina patagonica]